MALDPSFLKVIDSLPGLVWSSDAQGNIDYLNQPWRDYTGLQLEQIQDWRWLDTDMLHPDDQENLLEHWRRFLVNGQAGEVQARLRRHDKEYRWFLFRVAPMRDESGRIVKWWGLNIDIDESKWQEALIDCERRLLERIGGGAPLNQVLEEFCRRYDELHAGGARSQIFLLEKVLGRLERAASAHLPRLETLRSVSLTDQSSACARAARTGQPVFADELSAPELTALGLRSNWSLPILDPTGEVLGTFSIFWPHTRPPGQRDLSLLEQFTQLAGLTIERAQVQTALQRSRAYLAKAEHLSQTGSFGWCLRNGEMYWSEETCCIFGYTSADRPALELMFRRVHPQDLAAMHGFFASPHSGRLEFRLLMPDGRIKHLEIVLQELGQEFVGAVMDVSAHRAAEASLKRHAEALDRVGSAGRKSLESLAEQPDLDRLFTQVLSMFCEYFGAETARIWLGDYERVELYLHFDRGDEQPTWTRGLALPLTDSRLYLEPGRIGVILEKDYDDIEVYAVARERLRADGIKMTARVPMFLGAQMRGLLTLRFREERDFSAEETALALTLCNQLTLMLELQRLFQGAQASALDDERRRLARDMHDTLAQTITGVILQLEAAPHADAHVRRALELARQGLLEARRAVRSLRPQALEELDLAAAIPALLQSMTAGTQLRASFSLVGEPRPLRAIVEENLLRIVQEVVTNCLRHARASRMEQVLTFHPEGIALECRDDGRGFDPQAEHAGLGLVGIRERALAIGAELEIESRADQGTVVVVRVPA